MIKNILLQYQLRLVSAVTRGLYFPYDQISSMVADPKADSIENTAELTQYFYEKGIEYFERAYDPTVFQPLVWVQDAPPFLQKQAQHFLEKVFEMPFTLNEENLSLLRMQEHVVEIQKYPLRWRYFLTEVENTIKKIFSITKKQKQSALLIANFPVMLYAIQYLLDDADPDNRTAQWPIELWVDRLPAAYQEKFVSFIETVYENDVNQYEINVLGDLDDKPLPRYFITMIEKYVHKK